VAVLLGGTVAGSELARVWRRGSAPLPAEAGDVLEAGAEALEQTLEVAIAGYRRGSRREHALLSLLVSFSGTWVVVRASTHLIRARGQTGPFRNFVVGRRHIHHFVPGILLAFTAGGAAVVTRGRRPEPWLAVPFGAGVAMTLDEFALLLQLDDVYWTEEGVLSVQIALGTIAILSAVLLVLRILRRGEAEVFDAQAQAGAGAAASATISS